MVINLKYIYTNNYSNNLENIIKKVKSCSNVYGLFINVRDLEVNYNGEFIGLENYLEKLDDVSKNIILNIIPISNDSSDIVSIKRENKSYINNIQEITSKFPSLKFLYTSTNIRIIEELTLCFGSKSCGYYISDDLNFFDSSFYVLPFGKYDVSVVQEQIKKEKKLILFLLTYCTTAFIRSRIVTIPIIFPESSSTTGNPRIFDSNIKSAT